MNEVLSLSDSEQDVEDQDDQIEETVEENASDSEAMSKEDLTKLRIIELKKLLSERHMTTTGNKAFLIEQLVGRVFPDNVEIITNEKCWSFYIIINNQFTYCGVSPNPHQRLDAHNNLRTGGAKFTTQKSKLGSLWKHVLIINGFDKISCLQFEWKEKSINKKIRRSNRSIGKHQRVANVIEVLNRERFTTKSKKSSTFQLKMVVYDDDTKFDFKNLPSNVTVEMKYD
jgi:predicted GIY-YIG superfamily endonuclease